MKDKQTISILNSFKHEIKAKLTGRMAGNRRCKAMAGLVAPAQKRSQNWPL